MILMLSEAFWAVSRKRLLKFIDNPVGLPTIPTVTIRRAIVTVHDVLGIAVAAISVNHPTIK